MSYVGYIDGKK